MPSLGDARGASREREQRVSHEARLQAAGVKRAGLVPAEARVDRVAAVIAIICIARRSDAFAAPLAPSLWVASATAFAKLSIASALSAFASPPAEEDAPSGRYDASGANAAANRPAIVAASAASAGYTSKSPFFWNPTIVVRDLFRSAAFRASGSSRTPSTENCPGASAAAKKTLCTVL
eukprot:31354-Pelagococcus_subviridis.AAC.14